MLNDIPKNHPRYKSLKTREIMKDAMSRGLVHETGLIAHGRGEAFDYLLGENTISIVNQAEKVAAAILLLAKNPVISVNGNVVALASKECVELSKAIPAKIEVNLFHRTEDRMDKLINEMKINGAEDVLGKSADAKIPNLNHDRGICDHDGIFTSDVILVPLEDGDRCKALKNMKKNVIAIDLNPLSRTSKTADVTIVDEVVRAFKNITSFVIDFKDYKSDELEHIIKVYNNKTMLKNVLNYIAKRINDMF